MWTWEVGSTYVIMEDEFRIKPHVISSLLRLLSRSGLEVLQDLGQTEKALWPCLMAY